MGNSHSGIIGEITGGRKRYHRAQDRAREIDRQATEEASKYAAIAAAELAHQKLEMLQQLDLAVKQAKDNVEKWYNNALQQAKHINISKAIELQAIIQNLHNEQQQYLQKINTQYEYEIIKLNIERGNITRQIKEQITTIMAALQQTTSIANTATKSILNLHQRIYDSVHTVYYDLNIIYAKLTDPLTAKENKLSYYSNLAGWLDYLISNEQLTTFEHATYKKFLLNLCLFEVDLTTKNANIVNTKIQELLENTKHQQEWLLNQAYTQDLTKTISQHKDQQIAIDDLKGYWNQQEQELDRLYAAEVQRLQTEKNEQEISLKENLSRTLENLELENCKVKAQYEQICKELFQDYSKQISQIDLQKTVQIEQINSAHTQQIAEITVQLTQTLTVINDNLEHTLRAIKRKCKITSINFILAPFALAGAYFAPLLFTSASATGLAGIQSSLLATGIGSLVGALNKKAQIGIKVSLPIASTFEYVVPANNFENLTNNTITNSNQMYLFNLEKFQEKYQASVNQILTNKEKTENGLLYQLLKPILFTSDQYLLYKAAVKPRSALIESQDRSLDLKKSSRLDPLVKYNYYDPKFIGIKINVPNIFAQIWSFNHGHLGISMQYNKINTSIITANTYAVQVSSNNFSESNLLAQRSDFSVGFGGQLLIGCGRAFVKTGQGIKQLGLYSGEILGIVEAGRTVVYTAYINQEKALYNNTWVGQGIVARSGEILVSFTKLRVTDLEKATSSFSSTVSDIAKIPLALAALPFTLISSTAYASESHSTNQENKSSDRAVANWFEKCAVGAGRSTVVFGQKIKIAGIWAGEQAGIIEPGSVEIYNRKVNFEKELYDSTPIGQSRLGKGTEAATDLFFAYASGRVGIQAVKIAGETLYSRYTIGKAFKDAAGGGKYAGELRTYREKQSIEELRKTISSHRKTISKHQEYIKNPKLKYQNWDSMSQKWKDNAIHHWKEDIKRAKIYETFAKRILNENIPTAGSRLQIIPPIATVDKYLKSDSTKYVHDFEQSNIPKPPRP